jgi:hypothetical protein
MGSQAALIWAFFFSPSSCGNVGCVGIGGVGGVGWCVCVWVGLCVGWEWVGVGGVGCGWCVWCGGVCGGVGWSGVGGWGVWWCGVSVWCGGGGVSPCARTEVCTLCDFGHLQFLIFFFFGKLSEKQLSEPIMNEKTTLQGSKNIIKNMVS